MSTDVLSPPGGARIRFGFPGLPESEVNPPWEAACLRVLFVRLSPFPDAVRSTPHTVLFAWMRTVLGPGALGDFAFLPAAWERRRLEEGRIPWMAGLQTGRPAAEFDALCVSCSVVQELPNLPLMLLRAGIPPRASSRRAGPSSSGAPWPPVLLGGSSAALAHGLFFPDGDSFADGLYFGEIEPHAQDFFRTLLETRGAGADAVARELARRIPAFRAAVPGVLLPLDGQGFVPGTARSLVPWEQPASVVFDAPSADTVKLEISRGCPAFCSFCHEAWERRPYRELPADAVLEAARRLARETGASTVEVSAFNFNTHQEIGRLLDGLHRIFDRVNLMSQRADVLARHPWMLQAELAAEKRSFTVGVEGISRRMRRFYAKGFQEDAWRELLDELAKARVREIKLFFILAGIEGESDLAEFETFCVQFRDVLKKRSHTGAPRAVFSAGFLVRMPQTPLMFAKPEFARPRMEYLARRMEKAVTAAGFEFRMAMSWEEYVLAQVLVLPTPRTASILEESARQGWACDGRIPRELAERLLEDFRTSGDAPLSPDSWADAALVRAWERAAGFEEPSVCCVSLAADGQAGCHGCGACRNAAERAFLTGHAIRREAALAASLAEWVRIKRKSRPIHLRVVLPERFSGVSREYLEANLLAAALRACPELTGRLFGIREALWTHPAWEARVGAGWCGATVVALYGVSGAMPDGSPCLAARDVQDVAAALEGFLGASLRVLERFDASEVTGVRAVLGWNGLSAQVVFASVRGWLSELKVAFTERRLPAVAGAPAGEARSFDIAPRDRRKLESVVCRVSPEEGFVRAELRMEGSRRWEPAPLLRILGADCRFRRIEDFTLSGG